MHHAMLKEIRLRKSELNDQTVSTIYFGGGTPSFVGIKQLSDFLNHIHKNFSVDENAEITLEANPDDLNKEFLQEIYALGINRLSIGTQSFDDVVLEKMNRAHKSRHALQSIQLSQDTGFENITIDLIYGIPDTQSDYWEKQLKQFLQLEIPHLSAYHLTIEPRTTFGYWQKKGQLNPVSDERSNHEFSFLMDVMEENGYDHYEISNFAREGFISCHNTSYWLGKHYLGIGPSAHSYDGESRSWNIAHNLVYIQAIEDGRTVQEKEILSKQDQYNDYILTRLRTKWGLNLNELNDIHPIVHREEMDRYIQSGHLTEKDHHIFLTKSGKFIADGISADLFV